MEPEYSNGWDDNIDSGLGGNDASSTALRRYSPSPSPKRNLSRSRSRSPIRQSLNNGNNGGGYSRHDEGRRNYRRRSRSRSPANNNRHGRPFYRDGSRSRTDDRYRRGPSPGRRDRRSRSPNSSFMPQAPPRQARVSCYLALTLIYYYLFTYYATRI
ncbi:hypothetical protein BDF19DRAFT_194768 [Syncephalis fuscata]|nr:hypothetical protein BDF19DRAFT_194768 [Syncephalis fuscata]